MALVMASVLSSAFVARTSVPGGGALARAGPTVLSAIPATAAAAQQQQDELFALAPWEKMPKFDFIEKLGRPTTLDTRAFIKPFDRGGVTIMPVYADQEGLNVTPRRRLVGIVAVEGEGRGPHHT